MITPLNTEWNRKSKLTGSAITALLSKNGIVYFKAETGENALYVKCEENLFKKNFGIEGAELPKQLAEGAVLDLKLFIDYMKL
jgi:hypothetical protein